MKKQVPLPIMNMIEQVSLSKIDLDNLQFKQIQNGEQLLVKRLLYAVYSHQGKWEPSPLNPSQMKYHTILGQDKILSDPLECEWYALQPNVWDSKFTRDDIVSGCRLMSSNQNKGKLELELYQTRDQNPDLYRILDKLKNEGLVYELNRLVTQPRYQKSNCFISLLLHVLQKLEKEQASIIAASPSKALFQFLSRIRFPYSTKASFKYEKRDPSAVIIYYASYKDGDIKTIIERLKTALTEKHQAPSLPFNGERKNEVGGRIPSKL